MHRFQTPKKPPDESFPATRCRKRLQLALIRGGFKEGTLYGATDEFSNKSVKNRANPHTTVLHQTGIVHMQLTYRFDGPTLKEELSATCRHKHRCLKPNLPYRRSKHRTISIHFRPG
ncbi:MAG: DUF1501 domain-containing protein [Fuerstiella sp.]|nr:DUF1501 domain-containing protein [Fuerstiella sp.]MCP4511809.1 DUF1501 domain-containing protein [Fuerstiella sp.]